MPSSTAAISSAPIVTTNYTLTDDLAQYCLPAASRDANRKLAWANSICFLFVVIGLIGLHRPLPVIRTVEEAEEIIPAVFEPPVKQVVNSTEPPPEETESESENVETPQVVTIVAADPSAAAFAVPVTGNVVLAPVHLAQAPPLKPPKQIFNPPKTNWVVRTGKEEGFSQPLYPLAARQKHQQGKVVLYVKVDQTGLPATVEVKESCGYPALDNHSAEWVRKRWQWQPGETRYFIVPIDYQLKD